MSSPDVHQCNCSSCLQQNNVVTQQLHHQINVLLSRLDEQQRRWYAALEAKRHGHGGIGLLSQITGLDEKTIGRGQQELAQALQDRPMHRVRLPGAGRPTVKKNNLR